MRSDSQFRSMASVVLTANTRANPGKAGSYTLAPVLRSCPIATAKPTQKGTNPMHRASLYIALLWTAILLFAAAKLVPVVMDILIARASAAGGGM